MNLLDLFIEREAKRAVKLALASAFAPEGVASNAIREIVGADLPPTAPLNRMQFLFAMSQRFAAQRIKPDEARKYAADTLREFLNDEKIKFGDRAYSWTRADAWNLAVEYEISHWERDA